MRKFALLGSLWLSLGSCATTQYGDFAKTTDRYNRDIATDTVKELATLYPPAHTRFNIEQATPDAFGTTFIAALRSRGYAVAEYQRPGTADHRDPLRRAAHPYLFRAPSSAPTEVALRYVVDQLGEDELYRVTLWLDDASLSRAYVAQDRSLVPAGYWTRKE